MGFPFVTNKQVLHGIPSSGVHAATPPTLTDGNQSPFLVDSTGNLLVNVAANSYPPATVTLGKQHTQIANSTSTTTIVTAGTSGIYNDILKLIITNASSTAVTVEVSDGTVAFYYNLAANGGVVDAYPYPFPLQATSAATAWTATLSVNTVTVDFNVQFVETTVNE